MKVVINNCFGGFSLSYKAVLKYAELSGFKVYGYVDIRDGYSRTERMKRANLDEENFIVYWLKEDLGDETTSEKLNNAEWFHDRDVPRNDPNLVKTVKALKKEANGRCADLKIVTIPDDADWEIIEYDGSEHIAEKHRTWR